MENEFIEYFFADEDWIVAICNSRLHIWGFDEANCKVLEESLARIGGTETFKDLHKLEL